MDARRSPSAGSPQATGARKFEQQIPQGNDKEKSKNNGKSKDNRRSFDSACRKKRGKLRSG
jgi:hypothetical protein